MADVLALAEVRQHPERYRGLQGPRGERGPRGEQGPQGKQGEPGLRWRGTWRADTQYERDDVVEYGGSSYVGTARSKGQKPVGGSWDLVASRGESAPWGGRGGSAGTAGPAGPQGEVGPAGATGPAGADAPSTLDVHLMGWDGSQWINVLGDSTGRLVVTS